MVAKAYIEKAYTKKNYAFSRMILLRASILKSMNILKRAFKSWEEGGLIRIMLTKDKPVWVSKKPLFIHAK